MLNKLVITLTALLALTGGGVRAQDPAAGHHWCGTAAEQERYFAEHPGAREAQQAFYQHLAAWPAAAQRNGTVAAADVTIPVVVHVIHAGGADNISDEQINSALDVLNTDYQKRNADAADTSPLFQPIAAAVGFQFRLAKKDPAGNCTTGITRHYAPTLVNDKQNGTVQGLVQWDHTRYLNIWVVNTIGLASLGGTVAGYTYLPPTVPDNQDGLVIRQDYFGDRGTSSSARARLRTITHEIGHYFGLQHPWGIGAIRAGNCRGTDYVDDTPPTNGTFRCDLNYAPCGPIANVQNYMDYAACATMFTEGQKALMRNVLATLPERSTLATPANLVATGTNDGYVAPTCAPVADFGPAPGTPTSVCVNTPVPLRDYSANTAAAAGPLTYSWSFPGGTPATATGPNVTVSYANAGFYAVTETVSNGVGSSSSTVTNLIRVEGPTSGETAPFAQSFEDPTFPNVFPEPTLRNYATGVPGPLSEVAFRWSRSIDEPAAEGQAYLQVRTRYGVSTLLTPNIDLSSVSGAPVLRFARAFALRTASSDEKLFVRFSNDCGVSWSRPVVLDAATLSTQGTAPNDGYRPTTRSDWQALSIPIPAQYHGSSLFKVLFEFVNNDGPGNTFYFDDLRIGTPLGLSARTDALAQRGISVYPTPLTPATAVHLTLPLPTAVAVRLTDVLGRDVLTLSATTYGAGAHTLPLTPAGTPLRAGLYVVHITLGGETFNSKLTVE